MDKTFLIIISILCLPFTSALYGGETWTYHFDHCDELRVNVTGTSEIINGEYTILNNCTKAGPNKYVCNCTDDYDFNVSFKTNAVNNYTFNFNYDYYEEEPTITVVSSSGGGGGSRGYTSSWICGNWSECINNKEKRVCIKGTNKNINFTQSRSCKMIVKEKEEAKAEEMETKDETEIIEDIKVEISKNETEDQVDEIPTKEDESWIYLGIVLITIMFIIFGGYLLYKSKSESD